MPLESEECSVELRADCVSAGYRSHRAVDDVSIELARGRVTALIGPNGSGKSTLLRTIAKLHPKTCGDIVLGDETPIHDLAPRVLAQRLTLLSQSRVVPGGVTVREVVEYGRHPHRPRWRGTDPQGPEIVDRALVMTDVASLADRPVDTLSGGQMQRVWLASCLAQDTSILLLDEPTNHLDLRYQVELLDIVRDLADHHQIAIGVVLHDLDQAASVADEVVLLVDGRITAAGPPADVMTSELLSSAYGITIDVHHDPHTGQLRTGARSRHAQRVAIPA
ncbi:iron complex transport system ATP-binding protein [Stackebrandtia endophytica]|uniref:Iron complex transport system ATP-binding protein n=1 Tax=Stackebrandtia endophytica TaxID=1496996 RepID=A0A543ATZ3_9ACTN|nr:ABC transporter ATP-binding protein [Stackebrandtia endophytica]TQL76060.1 iron complex transport system ATP-binding protein [Stackebrandtia endophytica]